MATKCKDGGRGDTRARKLTDVIREHGVFPNRPTQYTGDLAQPLRSAMPSEEILSASPGEFDDLIARWESENSAELRRRFDLLFTHYQLEYRNFFGLAIALAFAHVPGLQNAASPPRRGRPTKRQKAAAAAISKANLTGQNVFMLLGEALNPQTEQRKSGRPVRWDAESQRDLVAAADHWKQSEKATGRRVSDADFVRVICDDVARNTGERSSDVFKREGRALTQALSRARNAVLKP